MASGGRKPTVTSRYGPDKRRRMIRCGACKVRFSEREGTHLFDSRLPPARVGSARGPSPRAAASARPAGSASSASSAGAFLRERADILILEFSVSGLAVIEAVRG